MDELTGKAYTSIPIPTTCEFFMRLPSSSFLILASLVVSSSSLFALAAPVASSYAPTTVLLAQQHAPISSNSDDSITLPNSEHPVTQHLIPL